MKKYFCFYALLLCVFVALSGCGKNNSQNGNNGNTAGTNSNTSAVSVKLDTPENTFKAFQTYMTRGEFENIYELFSDADKKQFDIQAVEFKKQQEARPLPPNVVAKMKQLGVPERAIANPEGRDMFRISLVIMQFFADSQTPKGQPVKNVVEEVQKETGKVKIIRVEKLPDGKTVIMTLGASNGQPDKSKYVLENGEWKMAGTIRSKPEGIATPTKKSPK